MQCVRPEKPHPASSPARVYFASLFQRTVMYASQEEIVARIEELVEQPVNEVNDEVNDLKSEFYQLNHQKYLDQLKAFKAEGGDELMFHPEPNPLEGRLKELLNLYKDRKAKYLREREEEEKKNLTTKRGLIEDVKKLIDNEENIGRAFDAFKDLQDKWRKTGRVPAREHRDLYDAYRHECDRFYHNISINRELKEYDLKKNLELRTAIVNKLAELQNFDRVMDIQVILDAAREEWDECGPVSREAYPALRERYQELVRALHQKIQAYYDGRKEELKQNLEKKEALIARVNELLNGDLDSPTKWNKAAEELNAVRDEWRSTGHVDRKHNERVWDAFKKAQDDFFNARREFLSGAREKYKANRDRKRELIAKAVELKESTDWKGTSDALIKLQKQWKDVPSAGLRDDQRLWNDFRAACDHFFTAKKAWFDGMGDREAEALRQKEELVARMRAAKPEGSDADKVNAIRAFQDEWNALGMVPRNDMRRISDAYNVALNALYDGMGLGKQELASTKLKERITSLATAKDGAELIDRERAGIRRRISELEAELLTYENNMAFFKFAKPDNPLLLEAQKRIARLKADIDAQKDRLKVIREAEKAAEKAAEQQN